jgi:hypothetical protein
MKGDHRHFWRSHPETKGANWRVYGSATFLEVTSGNKRGKLASVWISHISGGHIRKQKGQTGECMDQPHFRRSGRETKGANWRVYGSSATFQEVRSGNKRGKLASAWITQIYGKKY